MTENFDRLDNVGEEKYRDLLRDVFTIKELDTINKDYLVVHVRETDYTQIDTFLGYDFYKSLID